MTLEQAVGSALLIWAFIAGLAALSALAITLFVAGVRRLDRADTEGPWGRAR